MKGKNIVIDTESIVEVAKTLESLGFEGRTDSKHLGNHHCLLDRESYKIKLSLHKDVDKWGGYGNYEPHYSTDPDKDIWRMVKKKIEEDFELIK